MVLHLVLFIGWTVGRVYDLKDRAHLSGHSWTQNLNQAQDSRGEIINNIHHQIACQPETEREYGK